MSSPWSPLSVSFWTLHTFGWGIYGILWFLASLPVYESHSTPLLTAAIRTLYYVSLGASITLTLRPFYRRLWNRRDSLFSLLGIALCCSLLGSAAWLLLFEGFKWPLNVAPFSGAYGATSLWYFARPVISANMVLMAWSALYFGIKYQRGLVTQRERTLRAETLARDARLQALRYQLNPHFLFNTLNTLLSLIGEDDQRAKQFVHELAEFLRYSLLNTDVQRVTVREEIDVIRAFLSIEKLRFDDDLDIRYDVDSSAESVPLPPFLIQPLVENAVKHGRPTHTSAVQVRLSVWREDSRLFVEVRNSGRLACSDEHDSKRATGIGLSNLRERLEKLFPERHHFNLWDDDGWVWAQLVLNTSTVTSVSNPRTDAVSSPITQ